MVMHTAAVFPVTSPTSFIVVVRGTRGIPRESFSSIVPRTSVPFDRTTCPHLRPLDTRDSRHQSRGRAHTPVSEREDMARQLDPTGLY